MFIISKTEYSIVQLFYKSDQRISTAGKSIRIIRIVHFYTKEHNTIFHIFNQEKGFNGIVVNQHCHLSMEGHLKFRLQSL